MLDRKELKNRGSYLNVSKFGGSRGCSVIIAILFGGWGIGLIYLIVNNYGLKIGQLRIPVLMFSLCLIFGAVAFLRQALKKPKSHFNLSFNEHRLLKKARLPNIFFLVFITVFCSLPIGVGIFGREIMPLIIGLVFLIIFVFGGIYGLIKSEKRIKLSKVYGTTNLVSYSALSLGNTCEFIIKNNSPELQLKDVQINLRFIEEIYKSKQVKRKKKSSSFKIFYSSVQHKTVSLENGESMRFQFTLPLNDQLTKMDFKEPKYWELTCSSEDGNYFSRFILDVES